MKGRSSVARLGTGALIFIGSAVVIAARPTVAEGSSAPATTHARTALTGGSTGGATNGIPDSLRGRSGKLLARFKGRTTGNMAIPAVSGYLGDSVTPFSFIAMLPFEAKREGKIGTYRIGYFPSERRTSRSDERRTSRSAAYARPEGFIRVTRENQNVRVSEHFRLRDFLTHDQHQVWPKYLVLREELIDKLELVIDELNRSNVPVTHMVVMSGFRTPQYNQKGVGRGRVKDSRHQFGDAADVFVDNNRDGRMDDLNGDGKVDTRDVAVIAAAVDRVERSHPDLVGGVGTYRATRAHGPFAHIDVRGKRARWG